MKNRLLQTALPFLALPLLATPALAQSTGVSHPEQLPDTATAQEGDHYVKPSQLNQTTVSSQPAMAAPAPAPEVSYPATGPAPTAAAPDPSAPAVPALIVRQPATPAPSTARYAPTPVETASVASLAEGDDSGYVREVPSAPHQLHEGTVLKARLRQTISTERTPVGTSFSAELLADVGHSGEVLLPAGSVIHGRVAAIHGGHRITGLAAIRLQPEEVTLPDGSSYRLRATVSDLEGTEDAHVNDEGAIQPKTHPKAVAATLAFTTGTAAVAGAVVGGGVGAIVGASIGAGIGAIWWLKRDHQETLFAGTTLFFSTDEPLQFNPR